MALAFRLLTAHGTTLNGSLAHGNEKFRTQPLISVMPSIRYTPGGVPGGIMLMRDSAVEQPGFALAVTGGNTISGCEPSIATSECEMMYVRVASPLLQRRTLRGITSPA